jgi:DNA repair protein RecN (Recombination protein N)
MVFDEVDVGIGGAVAEVVGRLLAGHGHARPGAVRYPPAAGRGPGQPVTCWSKSTASRQARRSALRQLDDAERVEEIARMLGGVKLTAQTRAHAREMLEARPRGAA